VERGHSVLELPTHLVPVRVPVPAHVQYERGRVRLRVDMPISNSSRLWEVGCLTGVFAAIWVGFAVLAQGHAYVLFVGVGLALGAYVLWRVLRPGAKREVLVIDSRFVTVGRGDTVVAVLGRRQLTDLRLNDEEIPRWLARLPWARSNWPKIVWGGNIGGDVDYSGGVAAGISVDAASRILEEIVGFCEQHPADDEFDYRGAGTPFG
jgi:hypothetical protein